MSDPRPSVVVLAGPNGAGKSTAAPALLQGTLGVTEFVNADDIARYLAGVRNFFDLYERLASTWRVYDNSGDAPQLIAERLDIQATRVYHQDVWTSIVRQGDRDEG